MKKKWLLLGLVIGIGLISTACGSKKETSVNEQKSIRVGVSPGPYSELFIDVIKPILETDGYTVEEIEFSDLIQADTALSEGTIDLNVDQHSAYLNNFNDNKGANLIGITSIPTVPAGIFSGRRQKLTDIADGDKIGIPDDASNTARAFNLLQKAGWITLKKGTDPTKVTKEDIESNPKKLEIIQMASSQIPRSLEDLDFAVIPGSVVYSANLDPKASLLSEDVLKEYELVVAIDKKNEKSDWVNAVVAAYHSEKLKSYMDEHNQDNYWFIPNE